MSEQRITSKAELLATIAQCTLNAPHVVPLLTASYRDEISLACVARGHTAPLKVLDRARMPSVVLVGDDLADGLDPGPQGWPGLPRLARWARFAVINGTGGYPEHYETFVALARLHRKLVVIETGTLRVHQWLAVCRDAQVPTIVVRPADGSVQPAMPRRESMH